MVETTLTDRDLTVLALLRRGRATVEALADALDYSPSYLRERLPELADNGLVRRVDADTYELTSSGMRVLATSAGLTDERLDTPEHVERRIEALTLRPDEVVAVRTAFTFLRYWGEATMSEIADAVYSEHPASYPSADEWWSGLVRDALAELPDVRPPESDDDPWQYTGTPLDDEPGEDGRLRVEDADATGYGSVKHALESHGLDETEKAVVSTAFEFLRERREATGTEIRSAVYPDNPGGYDTAERWWTDCVRDALAVLPDVEPPASDESEGRWRYREFTGGTASADPPTDLAESPLDGDDEPS